MNIIFMGTPQFAVPALLKLIQNGHNIAAVYSQPPRPAGRGQKEQLSPIHKLALSHELHVETPTSLRGHIPKNADIAIVAAYGLLLPEDFLQAFQYGCINIHPSLLPRWRGAAPIQRSILAGDKKTGVCIMQMDKGLDTGDILLQREFENVSRETFLSLHDKLSEIGGEMVLELLANITNIKASKQSDIGITYATKLAKEEGKIDFALGIEAISKMMRALYPWPGCYFEYRGENIKLLSAEFEQKEHNFVIGEIINKQMYIACVDGIIKPILVQKPGRKAISGIEFMNGNA